MLDMPSAYAQTKMLSLESFLRQRGFESNRLGHFHIVARSMVSAASFGQTVKTLERMTIGRDGDLLQVLKAAQEANTFESVWGTPAGRNLSQAFLESIAEGSLLEQLIRLGFSIPDQITRVLMASGAVADVVTEGDPKPVKHLDMSSYDAARMKAAAIVVMSEELQRATGKAAGELFKRELTTAVLAAVNAAVMAQFTNVTHIASTGSALGDLAAGLAAAETATGYVVAADPSAVRAIALEADGRMSINGGEYVPGVVLVPIPSDSNGGMRIIPASRVGVIDDGLVLRESTQGTVMMSDTPTSPAELVSLWQTDSIGLLVERSFALVHDTTIVEVG